MTVNLNISIRHRFANTQVTISPGAIICGRSITFTTIPALLSNGDLEYREFAGGFEIGSQPEDAKPVKLVNITGFYANNQAHPPGTEIQRDHYVVGFYYHQQYYVALKNGLPRQFPIVSTPTSEKVDNVIEFRRQKR